MEGSMSLKPQQQDSNMTIELPADAVEILSNGKNAYIHMDGTVYRVIEESKYWEAISTERQRVIDEVKNHLFMYTHQWTSDDQ